MLTRSTEKAIPHPHIYLEFAAKVFETHEAYAYVDHVLARQQEIHDLAKNLV